MKCDYGCGNEALYKFKNNKMCCSKYTSSCPAIKLKNKIEHSGKYRNKTKGNCSLVKCKFCLKDVRITSIKRHEEYCIDNPFGKNIKICPICNKKFKGHGTTCSYGCSNTYFRSGKNNPNWKEESYRSTCFEYHEKKCIICGESNIVAVHHFDKNKKNNNPENLIPMCPTHHQYLHSGFKYLIEKEVLKYIEDLKKK